VVYGLFAAFVADPHRDPAEGDEVVRRAFAGGFAALGAKLALAER